jgi:hypothetical protein
VMLQPPPSRARIPVADIKRSTVSRSIPRHGDEFERRRPTLGLGSIGRIDDILDVLEIVSPAVLGRLGRGQQPAQLCPVEHLHLTPGRFQQLGGGRGLSVFLCSTTSR